MYCDWGSGWHDSPYYYGGLAALLLLVCILGIAAFVYWYTRRKRCAQPQCPACGGAVEEVFLRCPFCGTALKRHCPACHRVIGADFRFCPYCSAATGPDAADPARDATVTDPAPATGTGNQA